MPTAYCPKCDADVSDSYQDDDWSVGIIGGYYCDACDHAFDVEPEWSPDDVPIAAPPRDPSQPIGTPLSELSGRPGQSGHGNFRRIAKSWGYD